MATLLELATLGTADLVAPTLPGGSPAAILLDARADEPFERRLLLLAGCAAVLAQGAPAPTQAPPLGEPSPPERRALLPIPIARLVVDLLHGEHRDLLGPALARLASADRVLPPSALVPVLERVTASHHDAARPLLGARARWLAAQNPAWSWVTATPEPTGAPPDLASARGQWETGSPEARAHALRVLRDQTPDEALGLLFAGWMQQSIKERLLLLDVVAEAVTVADAAFLGHLVATERSQRTRAAARRLLVRSQGSELGARMLDRAVAAVQIERPAPRPGGLVSRLLKRGVAAPSLPPVASLTPPAELAEDWRVDGIEPEPAGGRWGPRTGWVAQVLALVAPSALAARHGLDVQDLALAVQDDDLALLEGMSDGALLHADLPAIPPLWDRWQRMPQEARARDARADDQQGRLLAAMPVSARAERIVQLMTEPDATSWWPPLAIIEDAWPETVGLRWVALLREHLMAVAAGAGEGTSAALTWRSSLSSAAARLPVSCLPAAVALPEPAFTSSPRWARALPSFQDRITIRLRIEQAVAALAPGVSDDR